LFGYRVLRIGNFLIPGSVHGKHNWQRVSIKAHLTLKQRNLERDLEKSAASKNLTRSREEKEEGRAWKVVGKRGEKVMRLVKLYQEEEVLESGRVQVKDQTDGDRGQERNRKRGRRQSGSPTGQGQSSPSSRRARIQPSPFGDLEVVGMMV
jgi:hypothetical protein